MYLYSSLMEYYPINFYSSGKFNVYNDWAFFSVKNKKIHIHLWCLINDRTIFQGEEFLLFKKNLLNLTLFFIDPVAVNQFVIYPAGIKNVFFYKFLDFCLKKKCLIQHSLRFQLMNFHFNVLVIKNWKSDFKLELKIS